MRGRFNLNERRVRPPNRMFQTSPDEKPQISDDEGIGWDTEDVSDIENVDDIENTSDIEGIDDTEPTDFEPDAPLAAYHGPRSRGLVSLAVFSLTLVAAVGAWLVIGKVQPTWAVATTDYIESSPTLSSWISGRPPAPQAPAATPNETSKPPPAQLIVDREWSGPAGQSLPLNLSISDVPANATIVINGLAEGATLNVGKAAGGDGWQLSAADLHNALVRPSPGFVGAMALAIELRLANDIVADRKTLRLQWAAPPIPQIAKPAIIVRHLDPDEIAALRQRGENFIATGDLASARLVLQRAAEAGDAQAALALAGTYDPIALERLGLKGPKSDIEKARTWYKRAQELGSASASGRLQSLADHD